MEKEKELPEINPENEPKEMPGIKEREMPEELEPGKEEKEKPANEYKYGLSTLFFPIHGKRWLSLI